MALTKLEASRVSIMLRVCCVTQTPQKKLFIRTMHKESERRALLKEGEKSRECQVVNNK